MQLLFVFAHTSSHNNQHASLAGMAQLSAAFGQQVSIWCEALPSPALINDCRQAGIDPIYVNAAPNLPKDVTPLDAAGKRLLIAASDRVVRL